MPGMPEIFGESQLGTLNPDRTSTESGTEPYPDERAIFARTLELDSGTITSPLRLRLNDFSGEGERAPPR
jgi:hypothetical protein